MSKIVCPNCGNLVESGEPFCQYCGNRLPSEPQRPPFQEQSSVEPPVWPCPAPAEPGQIPEDPEPSPAPSEEAPVQPQQPPVQPQQPPVQPQQPPVRPQQPPVRPQQPPVRPQQPPVRPQQPPVRPQQPPVRPQQPEPAPGRPGYGWIVVLQVFLWILFAGIIAGAAAWAVLTIDLYDNLLITGGIVAAGIFVAFLLISVGMVVVNAAKNLYRIAENTHRANRLLHDLKKK